MLIGFLNKNGMDLFVYSSIWTNLWTNQTYTADGMWPAGFYVSSQGDSMTLNAARNVIVSDVYPGDILNTDNLMTALGSTDPNYLATSLVTGFNGLADPYGNPGWTQASSGPDYDAYTGTYKHLETGEIHVLHSGSPTYMRSGVYLDFSNGSIINFHSDDYYMIVTPIN